MKSIDDKCTNNYNVYNSYDSDKYSDNKFVNYKHISNIPSTGDLT